MEKLPYCTDLFDKSTNLNSDEYLYTSFGPDRNFTIEKKVDNTIVLKVWNCYDTFKYAPKDSFILSSPNSLVGFLVENPRYYAENYFSKQLIHMDNWVNLIEGFKKSKYQKNQKFVK